MSEAQRQALAHKDGLSDPVLSTSQPFETDTLRLAKAMSMSGYFADVRDVAQAVVKILAGRELGFGPVASMTGVYLVQGKITVSAQLMAAAIKRRGGPYDYRVRHLTEDGCAIEFFEHGQPIGLSEFTRADAERAGLLKKEGTWRTFPRNMLFARALSNGARWYTPDIFGGPVYTPEEVREGIDEESFDRDAEVEGMTMNGDEDGGPAIEAATVNSASSQMTPTTAVRATEQVTPEVLARAETTVTPKVEVRAEAPVTAEPELMRRARLLYRDCETSGLEITADDAPAILDTETVKAWIALWEKRLAEQTSQKRGRGVARVAAEALAGKAEAERLALESSQPPDGLRRVDETWRQYVAAQEACIALGVRLGWLDPGAADDHIIAQTKLLRHIAHITTEQRTAIAATQGPTPEEEEEDA